MGAAWLGGGGQGALRLFEGGPCDSACTRTSASEFDRNLTLDIWRAERNHLTLKMLGSHRPPQGQKKELWKLSSQLSLAPEHGKHELWRVWRLKVGAVQSCASCLAVWDHPMTTDQRGVGSFVLGLFYLRSAQTEPRATSSHHHQPLAPSGRTATTRLGGGSCTSK